MTKQDLLSNPVFQKARDDASIYFVGKASSIYECRVVDFTVPRREDQTREKLRLGVYGRAPITKRRLLANLSFRNAIPNKTISVLYPECWHDLGDCDVKIDWDGNIAIIEK